MTGPRWGYFELTSNCRSCGRALPINGPLEQVWCAACFAENPIPLTVYGGALEMIDWERIDLAEGETKYRLLAHGSRGTYNLTWNRDTPRCGECGAELPERGPDTGDFHCPSCGAACTNFGPEGLFARLYPAATQIVRGQRATDPQAGQRIAVDQSQSKPVFLGCENCGGSLSITAEVPQLHDCQYCGAKVWIPEELWERLHPVESTRGWYVRIDGPPPGKPDPVLVSEIDERFEKKLESLEEGSVKPVMGPARWVRLQISTECPSCKHGIPVNGPLPHVVCSGCEKLMKLDPELIGGFLTWVEDVKPVVDGVVLRPGGQQFLRKVTRVPPTCARCHALLPEGEAGATAAIACPECGASYETFPVPEFLKAHAGLARQIYCGQREPDPEPGEGPDKLGLPCPSCGGELDLTARTRRLHTCEFCSSDVFVPDEVWRRFHPVANVKPWFVDAVTVPPPPKPESWEVEESWSEPEPSGGSKKTFWIIAAIGALAVIGVLVALLTSC